jgi:hypothetical protein
LKAPARSTALAGARRQAGPCASVLALTRALCSAAAIAALTHPGTAQAQFAGTLDLASVNRYRGAGTDDVGPVLRAGAMIDATSGLANGAYAGVSGLWRTRDAGLASADVLLGWSGRLDALPGAGALAPDWGWDAGVHRTHYGEGSRYDFSEAMLGLLAPDWSLHSWFAPHYFGGRTHTLYTELDAGHAFDDHWHAFAHVGWLHYGPASANGSRIPDRADTLGGIGYRISAWDIRLSRDGIVAGSAARDIDARQRRAAWLLATSVAF